MNCIASQSDVLTKVKKLSPLAGKPATPAILVDVPRLITAYYSNMPGCALD